MLGTWGKHGAFWSGPLLTVMALNASLLHLSNTEWPNETIFFRAEKGMFYFFFLKKRALMGLLNLCSECSSVCFKFLSYWYETSLLWLTVRLMGHRFERNENIGIVCLLSQTSESLFFSAQSALAWERREALDFASRCGQIHLCQWVFKIGTMQQLPQ